MPPRGSTPPPAPQEVARGVQALVGRVALATGELWHFAYEDQGGACLPRARPEASFLLPLDDALWAGKYALITESLRLPSGQLGSPDDASARGLHTPSRRGGNAFEDPGAVRLPPRPAAWPPRATCSTRGSSPSASTPRRPTCARIWKRNGTTAGSSPTRWWGWASGATARPRPPPPALRHAGGALAPGRRLRGQLPPESWTRCPGPGDLGLGEGTFVRDGIRGDHTVTLPVGLRHGQPSSPGSRRIRRCARSRAPGGGPRAADDPHRGRRRRLQGRPGGDAGPRHPGGPGPPWRYVCKVWPQPRTVVQNALDLDLARELGIPDRVTFPTCQVSRNLMPYLIAACDVYAAPSRLEGFGMPQVEAGACGKPVIGIRAMAMLDTLVHGETAFLARVAEEIRITETVLGPAAGLEPGHRVVFDQPRVADYRADRGTSPSTCALLNDPGLRHRMGAAGRRRAVARSITAWWPSGWWTSSQKGRSRYGHPGRSRPRRRAGGAAPQRPGAPTGAAAHRRLGLPRNPPPGTCSSPAWASWLRQRRAAPFAAAG